MPLRSHQGKNSCGRTAMRMTR
ncbi:hypothetical protein ACFFMP_13855 [Pseudoroseomonas cervicalis]